MSQVFPNNSAIYDSFEVNDMKLLQFYCLKDLQEYTFNIFLSNISLK